MTHLRALRPHVSSRHAGAWPPMLISPPPPPAGRAARGLHLPRHAHCRELMAFTTFAPMARADRREAEPSKRATGHLRRDSRRDDALARDEVSRETRCRRRNDAFDARMKEAVSSYIAAATMHATEAIQCRRPWRRRAVGCRQSMLIVTGDIAEPCYVFSDGVGEFMVAVTYFA